MARWRIGAVSIDCPDHTQLAPFYCRLLQTEVVHETDMLSALRVAGVWILVKTVPDFVPPTWPEPTQPQQLHLDFAVDDLDAAQAAAIDAGARKAAFQPDPEGWRVMLDPAGHPFCLNRQIPD
jgi:predicted enzyme related to lactoylglutathione lyase